MPNDLTTELEAQFPLEDERGLLTEAGIRRLHRTWRIPKGLLGWISNVNHADIGRRYIITAFVFFLIGGIEAALMRIQLAKPENTFLGPDLYNQIFSTHGTTMMFLFAVPMMEGIAIYLVPMMIGARNVAFPRLNALGYFLYLFGGILLYVALFLNIGPDAGWFSYVPLAGPEYSPGKRVDFWAQMITFTELAGLIGAVETVATVFKLRAPGMTLNRMPLLVWSMLIMSFMVLFAMPAVMLASLMLAMDRLVSTHFFNPAEGGDAILWQHLFWFFGHPEVYIIFIPALGMVSSIVETFTRRTVFGYSAMVLSLAATAFIGFGLWVHHMFATSVPQLGQSFFTAASMTIAIPSGVQIFCWIATLWSGKIHLRTPLLFILGFFFIFVMGGMTGVMLASVPIDLQTHDTYFVVAHFHYVLIGGAVFPLFGGLYYWYPKIFGRMLNDRLGRASFWLMFIGFNVTFFPMHLLGLYGMPRRVYTYLAEMGWQDLNRLASAGAIVLTAGVAIYLINAIKSYSIGIAAGENPWDASTLEWWTTSPPQPYVFAHQPILVSRTPLWDAREGMPVVTGSSVDCREMISTSFDAGAEHRFEQPGPSVWPLAAAVGIGVGFGGAIFTPWAIPAGMVLSGAAFIGWFWPHKEPDKLKVPGEFKNEPSPRIA